MIDQAELRQRLRPILEAEDRGDWDRVDKLSDELNRELISQNFEYSPEIVNQYLDDADIREKDEQYGEAQRRRVRHFADTGEFQDSTPIPLWTCGLVAVLMIAVLIWLLK